MAETFERVARTAGKLPLITVTNYDRGEEVESLKYYLSQHVQCVFNANPTGLEELTELCRSSGTQQILLDAPDTGAHTVATDSYQASLVLTRVTLDSLAAERRRGRVYFLGGMANHEVTKLRLAGFRAALQEKGIRYSDELFLDTLFNADSAYRRVELLFRSHDDVAGLFVNSLLPMDGLVRFFGEHPDLCRPVHYGVFDYHPMMDLLVDLHIGAIRQNPELMMQRAWEIFAGPAEHQPERIQYVPYEVIVAPTMRRFLPESRAVAMRGRSRESAS
jgi:DNA-binding LacI/PurR family transcriptional regulator